MTDKFHRFQQPTYTGAPAIPNPAPGTVTFNGVVYDYINVVPGGTGSSGSAFADAEKTGGPNAGTYFVAFGEDATSSDANRGIKALAENTDTLDDLFHQDIAYSVLPPYVSAVGEVSSIILLGPGIFVGNNSSYPLEMLFEIVDDLNREIYDPNTGVKIFVTSITGATVGSNFSTGNVTVNLNVPIQSGQTYSVWYGQRTNLATLPVDALNFHRIRADNEVDAEVEFLFSNIQGPPDQSIPWNQTPTTISLFDAASGGLNERYNRQAGAVGVISPPEGYWPTNPIQGTYYPGGTETSFTNYGSGAWFERMGPALTGYASNLFGVYSDPLQALFSAKILNSGTVFAAGSDGAVGFAMFGGRRTGASFPGEQGHPGTAAFLGLWPHHLNSSMNATSPYTRIEEGASAIFLQNGSYDQNSGESIVQVTQSGDYFRNASLQSSVAVGYDLLQCTFGSPPVTQTFVVVAHGTTTTPSDPNSVRVRNLDGTCPDFTSSPTGTIVWISTSFAVGDGAGPLHNAVNSDVSPVKLDGLFYQVPPSLSTTSGDDSVHRTPASFSAQDATTNTVAVQWGGFYHTTPYGPYFPSTLNGDGGMTVDGITQFLGQTTFGGLFGSVGVTFNSTTVVDFEGLNNFSDNTNFSGASHTTFEASSTLLLSYGANVTFQSNVTFGSTVGAATFQVGGSGFNALLELYGDSANRGTLTAEPGSIVNINGAFNFNGSGSTGSTNNNATFGASSSVYLNGNVVFGESGTTTFDDLPVFSFSTTPGGASIQIEMGGINFQNTGPSGGTAPFANTLYANSFIKAWGRFTTTASGPGYISGSGFNCTASVPNAGQIQINFDTNINMGYAIVWGNQYLDNGDDTGGTYAPVSPAGSRTSSGFTAVIRQLNAPEGAYPLNPVGSGTYGPNYITGGYQFPSLQTTAGITIEFMVIGFQ